MIIEHWETAVDVIAGSGVPLATIGAVFDLTCSCKRGFHRDLPLLTISTGSSLFIDDYKVMRAKVHSFLEQPHFCPHCGKSSTITEQTIERVTHETYDEISREALGKQFVRKREEHDERNRPLIA